MLLGELPEGAFGTNTNIVRVRASPPGARFRCPSAGASIVQADWVLYVAEADSHTDGGGPPPAPCSLFTYTAVARLMAEAAGAMRPVDFADQDMRQILRDTVKLGAKPFEADTQEEWKGFVVKPFHLNMVLRVQARAAKLYGPQSADATSGAPKNLGESECRIANAMEQYVKASADLLEEKKKIELSCRSPLWSA